jgi:hypothetical protein
MHLRSLHATSWIKCKNLELTIGENTKCEETKTADGNCFTFHQANDSQPKLHVEASGEQTLL